MGNPTGFDEIRLEDFSSCDGVSMRKCDFFIVNTRKYDLFIVNTRKYDLFIVNTHKYDFFIVTTRSYAVYFRNYSSQCDRSYGVTASQFHRNRTHGSALNK